MDSGISISNDTVTAILREEIAARDGVVTEIVEASRRLYARSTLPFVEEVRAGDQLRGGVALRADEVGVVIYPYVFREVCRNGAIMAHAIHSRRIGEADLRTPWEAENAVRDAIRSCSDREAFAAVAENFHSAADARVDLAIALMPLLSQLRSQNALALLDTIMERYKGGGDLSRYGLANAVTSVAREETIPGLRWRLEEFGGGVAAGVAPSAPSLGPGVGRPQRAERRAEVAAG